MHRHLRAEEAAQGDVCKPRSVGQNDRLIVIGRDRLYAYNLLRHSGALLLLIHNDTREIWQRQRRTVAQRRDNASGPPRHVRDAIGSESSVMRQMLQKANLVRGVRELASKNVF